MESANERYGSEGMSISNTAPWDVTGRQKAAVFLLSIGEELTKVFFNKADEKTIRLIDRCMLEMRQLSSGVLEGVTDEAICNLEREHADLVVFESGSPAVSYYEKGRRLREICRHDPGKTERLILSWIEDESMGIAPAAQ